MHKHHDKYELPTKPTRRSGNKETVKGTFEVSPNENDRNLHIVRKFDHHLHLVMDLSWVSNWIVLHLVFSVDFLVSSGLTGFFILFLYNNILCGR